MTLDDLRGWVTWLSPNNQQVVESRVKAVSSDSRTNGSSSDCTAAVTNWQNLADVTAVLKSIWGGGKARLNGCVLCTISFPHFPGGHSELRAISTEIQALNTRIMIFRSPGVKENNESTHKRRSHCTVDKCLPQAKARHQIQGDSDHKCNKWIFSFE